MSGPGTTSTLRGPWIWSPAFDTAVAWSWVPFVVAMAAFPDQTALVLFAAFVLSFSHQPLTLALVYGDPVRFEARRRLFLWSPFVFAAAVALGLTVSLTLVALVAGLWNAEHTLMQRFGLARIYARRAGEADGAGLEKAMMLSWLAAVLVWVAADARTPEHLSSVSLGTINEASVRLLADLRPVAGALLWPLLAVVIGLTLRWLAVERGRTAPCRAKHAYMAATAAMFVAIAVQPVWGLAGFIGSHALEYFAVVEHSVAGERAPVRGPLAGLLRAVGSRGFMGVYLAAVLTPLAALHLLGLVEVRMVVALVVGGMHVFYDGLIWKLRSPTVARSVGAVPVRAAA